MSSANVALLRSSKAFADEQVVGRGYEATGDYICDLIRPDRDHETLRPLRLEEALAPSTVPVDASYYGRLRE